MLFCSKFPALVNANGQPKSWRIYLLGMGHLSRVRARDSIDMFRAMAAAQGASNAEREQWVKEQSNHAGWS